MNNEATPAKPVRPPDKTIEDALRSASRAFHSPRLAEDVRQSLNQGSEVEFTVKVRKHHDGEGFCLMMNRIEHTPNKQIFYRVKLA
jgi:hypothetical protein